MDIIVDRLGGYLKSLPPAVQSVSGVMLLAALYLLIAYAILTPDTICDGCP